MTKSLILLLSLFAPMCQAAEGNFTCDFCSAGLDFPDLEFVGFSSLKCSTWKTVALSADNQTECNDTFRSFEPVCCPSTTDLPICDYCSEGLQNPDYIFTPTNNSCAAIDISAKVSGERICEGVKYTEPLCCPSQASYKFPSVTEEESFCYICGSSSVEMTMPDAKPLAGVSSDPEDQFTCTEIQEQLNAERSGTSCMETLAPFWLRLSPAACGCAGVEPTNPCGFCNKDNKVNSAPAICNTVNVDLVESTCCIEQASVETTDASASTDASAVYFGTLITVALSSFLAFWIS